MSNYVDDFLDNVCSKIKYKTIHKDIRREMENHMEEMAQDYEAMGYDREGALRIVVSRMGDAEGIGKGFNHDYRMPFNCSFGFTIWAALVTVIIYLCYPLIYKIDNYTIKIHNSTFVILGAILLFAAVNVMYLRRGKLKMSWRDGIGISAGFFLGWIVAAGGLMIASMYGKMGYYPYFGDVPIPFVPFSVPMLPKKLTVFGMEFFSWWFCIIIYLAAVKSNRKTDSVIFLARFPGACGYVEVDDEFYGDNM